MVFEGVTIDLGKNWPKTIVDITNLFVHERMAEPENNMSTNSGV
jgi:hypothetical protein